MVDKWTADVVGKMHQYGITGKQLAAEIGWNPKYLSTVINGHKTPKNAEKTIMSGLDALIETRTQDLATRTYH